MKKWIVLGILILCISIGVQYGYVLGGTKLISDKATRAIFNMQDTDQIVVK